MSGFDFLICRLAPNLFSHIVAVPVNADFSHVRNNVKQRSEAHASWHCAKLEG